MTPDEHAAVMAHDIGPRTLENLNANVRMIKDSAKQIVARRVEVLRLILACESIDGRPLSRTECDVIRQALRYVGGHLMIGAVDATALADEFTPEETGET